MHACITIIYITSGPTPQVTSSAAHMYVWNSKLHDVVWVRMIIIDSSNSFPDHTMFGRLVDGSCFMWKMLQFSLAINTLAARSLQSPKSVYKLSPTSLSAFERTNITAPCTTPRRHQGQDGEVGRISPTCRLWRRDDEDDGRRQRDERRTSPRLWTTAKRYVGYTICLSVCSSFCLPHASYGGGTTTRRMVATTTAREDNMYIAEESTLAIIPVCCFWVFVNLLIFLLSPTCWGTRGQHHQRTYVGYTTYLFGCYLFGLPHAGYGRGIMTEDGGGDNGTRGQHCQRKYVGYTTCLLF